MTKLWNRSGLVVLGLACCALTAQCSGGDAAGTPGQAEGATAPAPQGATASAQEPSSPATDQPATTERAPVEAQPVAAAGADAEQLPPGSIRLADGGPTTRDLGEVREGESIETVFELVSGGEGPLVISSVKTTCGCTVPGIELVGRRGQPTPYEMGTPIPVGTRLRLLAKVYTQGKVGSFSASIMLATNDPVGLFSVRVEAGVEPIFECDPDRKVSIGTMGEKDHEVRAVRVRSFRGERFQLAKGYLPEGIQLELSPIEPDADGRASEWEAALGIGPGLPPGDVNYSIQLMSDLEVQDPKSPSRDGSPQYHPVTLVVQKLGLIYAQPGFLGFGTIAPGGSAERTLQIRARDGSTFGPPEGMSIEVVGTDGRPFEFADHVITKLVPGADGESLELTVKLENPPLETDRAFLGFVKVGVGHPEQPELSFNFTVTLKAAAAQGGG